MSYIFRINDNLYTGQHEILIGKDEGGKRLVAKPLEFVELKHGYIAEPALVTDYNDNFPSLIKAELMRLGLLQNADQATNDALKYHLEDMRALVFKKGKT